MIVRYGLGKFLVDSHANAIHSDHCGILYRMFLSDDEPLHAVRLINLTAEPDGTFREYFLRVPPTVQTARVGVAWSFGLSAYEYEPDVES